MSASNNTVEQIILVLLNHVHSQEAIAIVADLLEVQGNKSFRETVRALHKKLTDTFP